MDIISSEVTEIDEEEEDEWKGLSQTMKIFISEEIQNLKNEL